MNLNNLNVTKLNEIKKTQNGVGLIEVLITVVVMSIGLLGVAKMQVEGMRFNQNAYYQSQAQFLSSSMIDRMRSNIQGVRDGAYNGKFTSPSATKPSCIDCDPAQVAQWDLYAWSADLYPIERLAGFTPVLPGGATPAAGQIIRITDSHYAIELTWVEVIRGEDTTQRHRVQFELDI